MITGVHHVGVVVRDLDAAYRFWREGLGLPLIREAEVPDQGVRAALLACGPCEIELLEPTVGDSGVARFLDRRGEGAHHVCFRSDDVGREVSRLAASGVEMIDRVPRPGLAGRIAFLHPRATAGVLVELATPVEGGPGPASPLAVSAVELTVEGAERARPVYRDLLGLRESETPLRLVAGGVAVELSPGPRPGVSALRLGASDLDAVRDRLDVQGCAHLDAVGRLALDPAGTHGVPLVIHRLDAGVLPLGPRGARSAGGPGHHRR